MKYVNRYGFFVCLIIECCIDFRIFVVDSFFVVSFALFTSIFEYFYVYIVCVMINKNI